MKYSFTLKPLLALFFGIAIIGIVSCAPNKISMIPIDGEKSKLSIHAGWGQHTTSFIQQSKPRLVKLLDTATEEKAQWIKSVSPHTIIIARIYNAEEDEFSRNINIGVDPNQYAQQWWQRHQAAIVSAPGVDYWEGLNEPIIQSEAAMEWYARFEVERIRILASHGRKACIGNFSVGNPQLHFWPAFYPAIDKANEHFGILGLHEYGRPMQQDWDESNQEGWRVGRYRKVYNQYLLPQNRKIPLAITETGVDISGGQNDGWQSFYTPKEFQNQLDWYNDQLMKDDYVLGATIFALEIPNWHSFGIAPIIGWLIDHVTVGSVIIGGQHNKADVVVEDIFVTPERFALGDSIQIHALVKNVGTETTSDKVGTSFKVNGISNNGWWHTEPPMEPGASAVFTMDTLYLVTTNQEFRVEAHADDVNRFPETNDTNNTRTELFVPGQLPIADVIIDSLSTDPLIPIPGSPLTISATVRNIGTASTTDDVGVGFNINGEARQGYWHLAPPMAAGSQAVFTMDATFITPSVNSLEIVAVVDDINRFPESSETNNTMHRSIHVAAGVQADVLVQDIWITPSNPTQGGIVKIVAEVANIGGAITQGDVGVGFHINSQHEPRFWSISNPMAAGEVRTFTMEIDFQITNEETLHIVAIADDINRFSESNENNNQLSKSFSVSSGGNQNTPNWDSKLNDLGIQYISATPAPGTWYWQLVTAEFLDAQEAGGSHHIFYKALDQHGNPIEGIKSWQVWPDGNAFGYTKGPIDNYWGNMALYGSWCPHWPTGGHGAYSAHLDGTSDQVSGMGLPCNQHVSYRLIWQWKQAQSF